MRGEERGRGEQICRREDGQEKERNVGERDVVVRLRPGQAQLEDDGREKEMTAERAITEWCKMTQAGWPGWLRWQLAPLVELQKVKGPRSRA